MTDTSTDDLLAAAAEAHRNVSNEPGRALAYALDAGDYLIAAKAAVPHGKWSAAAAATGIPGSTVRLYMRLAAHRELIVAAGCTSIRQARALLTTSTDPTGDKPRSRPRPGRRSAWEE